MNIRGWRYTQEDVEHEEELVPLIEELIAQWNSLINEAEQRRFQRSYDEDYEPDFDTEEDYEQYKQDLRARARREQMKLELIELQLENLGARIMRPYEHWNEDERFMEYMERDRGDE